MTCLCIEAFFREFRQGGEEWQAARQAMAGAAPTLRLFLDTLNRRGQYREAASATAADARRSMRIGILNPLNSWVREQIGHQCAHPNPDVLDASKGWEGGHSNSRWMSCLRPTANVHFWRSSVVTTVHAVVARRNGSICFHVLSMLVFRYQLAPSRFACRAHLGWQLGEHLVCWDAL